MNLNSTVDKDRVEGLPARGEAFAAAAPTALFRLEPEIVDGLRSCLEVFHRRGFTAERLQSLVKTNEIGMLFVPDKLWVDRAATDPALATIVKTFLTGEATALDELEKAISAPVVAVLFQAGLLQRNDNVCSAQVRIMPWQGLYLCSDFRSRMHEYDYVLPPTSSAIFSLAAMFPKNIRPGRALDIGTGSGLIALVASRGHREVVGIDITARSLEFARLNGIVNRINADFILADAESLASRDDLGKFDLITFNAPLIKDSLSDRSSIARSFADGDHSDRIVLGAYRGAKRLLNAGGLMVISHAIQAESERLVRLLNEADPSGELKIVRINLHTVSGELPEGYKFGVSYVFKCAKPTPSPILFETSLDAPAMKHISLLSIAEIGRHVSARWKDDDLINSCINW